MIGRKCCAWMLLLLGVACAKDAQPRQPDVILIVVDTLRADRLGCYGYDGSTSPNVDAFAAESLVFENAYSHSSDTLLACSALVSGYLPHETKMFDRPDLPLEVPTLAETLQAEGYETAAVISNYVLRAGQGFEQGFDVFDSQMDQHEIVRKFPERIAEFTTERAIEILRAERERPLFLWVHYQDPHGPYTPPESFVAETPADAAQALRFNESTSGRGGIPMYQRLDDHDDPAFYAARYDGEVRYADEHIGRLFDTLKESGAYDEAILVFTADHGEGMGEHDYWFAHGEYLYRGQHHVPFILRWGDRFRGRRDAVVQHVDFVPTVLGLLGLPAAEGLRGTDLASTEGTAGPVVAFTQPAGVDPWPTKISFEQDGLKLIYTPRGQVVELFDLDADPGERNSLAADPQMQSHVRTVLEQLLVIQDDDRLGFEPADAPKTLTDEEREKLESLGYIR